ncbi:MAG: glycogen synthase GlgA [Candidatus Saganbacteria bacterium]|nr:glycogen synthase GlgA [Candidatus Saganbacteria bacterium]
MKIFFVSSEVVPFAKTGGLADVAGALPKAIFRIGHDIRIFMPLYKKIDREKWGLKLVVSGIQLDLGNIKEDVDVYEARMPETNLVVYFVDNAHFKDRDELYCLGGKDYPDNCEAFLTFCKAAIPFLEKINWRPDIVHCNDWQSAPLVLYLKEKRKADPSWARCATVYSIHNMAYQGNFVKEKFSLLGLPQDVFASLEFYGQLSFTKAGVVCADVINTVSPTYAKEIQTKEYGCGMEDLLTKRSKDVYGILNGVDYEIWNPATDQNLVKRYSANTLSLKAQNKLALQKEQGLEVSENIPLIGIVSRLDVQKGFDILGEAMEEIMRQGCQMVLLGTGDPKYHELFEKLGKKYPKQLEVNLAFDAALAERIYAGSDLFLIPSCYEPCGLGQLISFKYGTIPIVRKTGGLADTVFNFDVERGEGNGFVFEKYTADALFNSVKRALEAFKNKGAWKNLQEKVMSYDYSWSASAKKYISLYMKALNKVI